jgi:hypothetical protein
MYSEYLQGRRAKSALQWAPLGITLSALTATIILFLINHPTRFSAFGGLLTFLGVRGLLQALGETGPGRRERLQGASGFLCVACWTWMMLVPTGAWMFATFWALMMVFGFGVLYFLPPGEWRKPVRPAFLATVLGVFGVFALAWSIL